MSIKQVIVLLFIVILGITTVHLLAENNSTGTGALGSITTGTGNTAYGENAGAAVTTGLSNLFLGDYSGNVHTTGRGNIYLGSYVQYYVSTGATLSNQFYAGTDRGTIINGDFANGYVWFGGVRGSAEQFGFIANDDTLTFNLDGSDVNIRASDGPITFDTSIVATAILTIVDSLVANGGYGAFDLAFVDSLVLDRINQDFIIRRTGSSTVEFGGMSTTMAAGTIQQNTNDIGNDADNVSGNLNFIASDNDQASIAINTSDQIIFTGATGGYSFDDDRFVVGTTKTVADRAVFGDGDTKAVGILVTAELTPAGTDSSLTIDIVSGEPIIYFKASDGDATQITVDADDKMQFDGASGGYDFDNNIAAGANITITGYIDAADSVVTVGNITANSIVAGETDVRANGLEIIIAGTDSIALHLHGPIRIDSDETGLAAGQTSTSFDIVIDNIGVSAGMHHGMDVSVSEDNAAEIVALGTHTGVIPIMQHIGTFGAVGHALKLMNSDADTIDVAAAFQSTSDDSTLFNADDDRIFIGHASVFDEIQVTLNTAASASIFQNTAQTFFFYSTGQGTWTRFFPLDNTEGFQNSADIEFSTLAGWATAIYDSQTMYWIYIQRTRGTLSVSPIENTIRTLATTRYVWGELGHIETKSAYLDSLNTDILVVNNAKQVVEILDADDTITPAQSGTAFFYRPLSGKRTATLPECAAGLFYEFMVADADSLLITTQAGDSLITSAGVAWKTETSVAGTVKLIGIDAVRWVMQFTLGTWTGY